jgi:hypothetical protein
LPHREIVRDKHVGESEFLLEIPHQVQHLCLDGDIERRHRLIEHHERWIEGESTSHADALALTA